MRLFPPAVLSILESPTSLPGPWAGPLFQRSAGRGVPRQAQRYHKSFLLLYVCRFIQNAYAAIVLKANVKYIISF